MTYHHPVCPSPIRTMLRPARGNRRTRTTGTSLWRSVMTRWMAGVDETAILAACAPEARFIAAVYLADLRGEL